MRRIGNIIRFLVILVGLCFCFAVNGAVEGEAAKEKVGNKPERVEWFEDQALGMFIHWSVDSQLGSVIGHSMVGASEEYLNQFITELPKTFYPKHFDPDAWARLARLSGMKYVVFTTKHFSGFCMFPTKTTNFSIMNTPYGKDVTQEIVDAFRKHNINIGFYYAPEDNWLLHKQGHQISRLRPEAISTNNPELMAHLKAQLRELLSNYGSIDVLFLDGEPNGLKQLAWEMQPDIVVTRGEMNTPEQEIPDKPIPGPWEACFTMGTQWQYKPTNEVYKSGTTLIEMLIETRAKGGNLLINVGPTPDGMIPFEQERLLQELGLWIFINNKAIYSIRPWHITNEGDIWFTKAKDCDTVYAFVTKTVWPLGQRKNFTLKSVKATDETQIEILGQSGQVLEYQPNVIPKTTWKQDEDGLHISAMRAQRIYNDKKWPNPVVIEITNVRAF